MTKYLFENENNFFTRNVNNLIDGGIIFNYEQDQYGVRLHFHHKEIASDFSDNISILTGVEGKVDNNTVSYTSGGLIIIHAIGKVFEDQLDDLIER